VILSPSLRSRVDFAKNPSSLQLIGKTKERFFAKSTLERSEGLRMTCVLTSDATDSGNCRVDILKANFGG
ncbi:MAG: hypothetical protein ACLQOO_25890, partial [Terriglobia bacterium]